MVELESELWRVELPAPRRAAPLIEQHTGLSVDPHDGIYIGHGQQNRIRFWMPIDCIGITPTTSDRGGAQTHGPCAAIPNMAQVAIRLKLF